MTIDCLIVGFNDTPFASYESMLRAMGEKAGAYRDLRLAFAWHEGTPRRALDLYSELRGTGYLYNNFDYLSTTILYLGSYLEQHGFSCEFVNQFQRDKAELRSLLETQEVRAVAITTTLYVSPHPIIEIVSFIRQHSPGTKIIVGGPYISNLAANTLSMLEVFRYLGADVYVVSAEGEKALANVLARLKQDLPLDGVPNIAFREGKRHARTAVEIEDNALVETPIRYERFRGRGLNEFVSVRTAKSCPFSCEFCAFPTRAGRYNYMAVDAVERELDRLHEACGEATVSFLDDTFNVPKKRFRELLRMMIKKRYGFRWNSFYRSDHGDAETIELMKESGCQGVFLGTESGSNTILQLMNKSARREHYLEAIPRLREAGIITYASMIIGFPGETEETVAETVSLIETAAPDFFRAQLWYADPTTPVMEKKERHGIEGSGFGWRHATMDASTAADIIEGMFRDVKHSTWLPQWGFELWSVFYLIRHGMSLERVKAFAAAFNAAVRAQLESPGMRHVADAELVRLKETVRERV